MGKLATRAITTIFLITFGICEAFPSSNQPAALNTDHDPTEDAQSPQDRGVRQVYAATTTSTYNNDDYDPKVLRQWMNFGFIYSFVKYPAPSEPESEAATAIYDTLKDQNEEDVPIYSTLSQNVTLAQMKALVNKAWLRGLISKGEHSAQIHLLNSAALPSNRGKFLKTIREHLLISGNGDIIYGLTGLLQLSRKGYGGAVRGTLVNSFRKFKLANPPARGTLRYSRGKECILWETFCKMNVQRLGDVGRELTPGLVTYMRDQALSQFVQEYEGPLSRVGWEAYKGMDLLPEGLKGSIGRVLAAGDKRPDEVLGESQLHGHLYDL